MEYSAHLAEQTRKDITTLLPILESMLEGESNFWARIATVSSFIFHSFENVNWAGFYLFDGKELVVSSYCGKPACLRIAPERGVCGTAFGSCKTLYVPDVEKFPGHIACDAASKSEVVVPLFWQGGCIGVLDIDSSLPDRFSAEEIALFEAIAAFVCRETCSFPVPVGRR